VGLPNQCSAFVLYDMPARVRRTLAQMIAGGFQSFARCSLCKAHRQIDLDALMAKVGPDYSLWNRRCRCKLTKGCRGWNKFAVGPGWHTKDYDDLTEMRWVNEEWDERRPGL
jgi:hypothetical protein